MHAAVLLVAMSIASAGDGCCCCKTSTPTDVAAIRRENEALRREVKSLRKIARDRNKKIIKLEDEVRELIRYERTRTPPLPPGEYLRRLQTPADIDDGDTIIPAGE